MDAANLALTVQQLTPYLQLYGPIFATKAVEAAAEAVGERIPEAVTKLLRGIKAKFDTEGAAQSALEKLLNNPQDEKLKNVVEYHLEEYLENDAAFAEQIETLLKKAQAAAPAGINAADGSAVAVGEGAKAVAKGGILIEGGVKGDFTVGSEKKAK